MNQNLKRLKRQVYGDEQIVASGCCAAFVRSSSQTLIYQTDNSQKSLRSSKERGIKLTKKHMSQTKSASQTKINLQKSPQLADFNRNLSKRSSQSQHQSSNQSLSNHADKKSKFVQKCLQYKNKRIEQHRKQTTGYNCSIRESQFKEQVCSTMRNTLRTFNSSQGILLIQKPIIYSNSTSFQQPFLKRYKQQRSKIYSQRTLLINKKSTTKTLERIFQETQGKKIVTLESQILNEEYSNEYSIAESYQFPQTHI